MQPGDQSRSRARAGLLAFLVAVQLFLVIASVLAFRERPQGLIASDGKGYYVWLRSLALDGDLDFRNDFELVYPPDPLPEEPITPRGLIANKYPVGVALVELPGFVVGHAVARILGFPTDGVSAPYQFAVTLWLQIVIVLSLAALWSALVRLGGDPLIAVAGVVSALAATNLVQYAARPSMSHGPGFAVLCFALYLSAGTNDGSRSMQRMAGIGAMFGLAAIIRPSNVALAPFFFAILMPSVGKSWRSWQALFAAFCCVVAVQIGLMSSLWGHVQLQGYVQEGFTSGADGVIAALVSARHGLFTYHPWFLVTLVLTAFAAFNPGTRKPAVGALVSFTLLAIVNGTWWNWWFGDGFGNRSFVEIVPILLVPSALWLTEVAGRRRKVTVAAVAGVVALSAVNATLWVGYVLRRYPPDGNHSISQAYLWFLR